MTGAEAALGLGLRVKRAAVGVPAAAAVQNCQAGNLGGQFRFALLDERLPKLVRERRERVSDERSFFGLLVYENILEQLRSI